jgi:cyclase
MQAASRPLVFTYAQFETEFMNTIRHVFALHITVLASIGLALPMASLADSAVTRERTVTQIGSGLYVIRHADGPDGNPQGNTTVVIGERTVLVVDSGYLPSSAREDIAEIRDWTNKPIAWLVNTHWHPDHVRGNNEYRKAFPAIAIVAHQESVILGRNYEGGNLQRRPARINAMMARLQSGKSEDGKRLTAKEQTELRAALAGSTKVDEELRKDFRQELANVAFDTALDIDLGNREVQLRHTGPGDTLGDAWIYMPNERVLVAGDLLDHPVPYFFAGYPAGVLTTLRQLERLNVSTIVPGHGEVLHDKVYLHSVVGLLDSIITQVNAEVVSEGSLSARFDKVRAAIDTSAFRREFAGDDAGSQEYFDESIEGLIRDAFNQAPK